LIEVLSISRRICSGGAVIIPKQNRERRALSNINFPLSIISEVIISKQLITSEIIDS
jgi:hypothetical protein